MKSFEYGTSEYWANEVSKTGMRLSLMCKGLLTEAAEIVGNKELYDSAEISHYRYLREMCRTVVDAENEYDKIKAVASLWNKQMGDPKKDNEQSNAN